MGKIFHKINLVSALLAVILLFTQNVFAGAPAGHLDSLEPKLRIDLKNGLHNERYMSGGISNFNLSVSAYLWDNRHWLTNKDFPNARQADVMVCLMIKKGHLEFKKYAFGIEDWCNEIIEVPQDHH